MKTHIRLTSKRKQNMRKAALLYLTAWVFRIVSVVGVIGIVIAMYADIEYTSVRDIIVLLVSSMLAIVIGNTVAHMLTAHLHYYGYLKRKYVVQSIFG